MRWDKKMVTQSERLITRLLELVEIESYSEISSILEYLLEIEKFKNEIIQTPSLQLKFEKIQYELESSFNIHNLKIIKTIDGIDTTKYLSSKKENEQLNHKYKISLNDKTTIQIELKNNHLDKIDKIKLDLFLDNILTCLYVTIIIDTLQESTLLDPLTGLKNRIAFTEEMKGIIPLAIRENMKIGVLIVNIDRFRAVNDEHGTQFGDKFLQNYAKVIKNSIRSSDIAIRFGGGEFLILLMNVSSEDKTVDIATQIQTKLNNLYILSPYNDPFSKTATIGISMFPECSNDIFEAVNYASLALVDAQNIGRGQIHVYKHTDDGDIDFF
jgi:diguanylate cyclase (GGDEF)-like protein